jgi:hypothetical protein
MSDSDLVKRHAALVKRRHDVTAKRAALTAEVKALQEGYLELQQSSQEQFGVPLDALPARLEAERAAYVQQLDEYERLVSAAEAVLRQHSG